MSNDRSRLGPRLVVLSILAITEDLLIRMQLCLNKNSLESMTYFFYTSKVNPNPIYTYDGGNTNTLRRILFWSFEAVIFWIILVKVLPPLPDTHSVNAEVKEEISPITLRAIES